MTVGSSLRLVCVLRDNTQPPNYVFWYHDEEMINYHSTRGVGPLVREVADSKFLDGHRSDIQYNKSAFFFVASLRAILSYWDRILMHIKEKYLMMLKGGKINE